MTSKRNNNLTIPVFIHEKQNHHQLNGNNGIIKENKKEDDTCDLSPYDKSNFFGKYTFRYLQKLNSALSRKNNYELTDFDHHTPKDCLSKNVTNNLKRQWQKESKKTSPGQSASLLRAILRTYGIKLLIANFYFILSECICEPIYFYFCVRLIHLVGQSWALSAGIVEHDDLLSTNDNYTVSSIRLDENVVSDESSFRNELIWDACCFLVFICITTISTHPFIWRSNMVSLEMRAALGRMIYKKALKVDKSSRSNKCNQAIALISKDLDLIEINLGQVIWMISGPVECTIVTVLLINVIGLETALFSLAFSSAITIIRTYLTMNLRRYIRLASAKSDIRVSLVNETLKAIRVLRMYSWTRPLYEKIQVARKEELAGRKFKMLLSSLENFCYFCGCNGGSILTLSFGYFVMGIRLNQMMVTFVFLVTMIHQRTMSRYLPLGILSFIDLTIVFERIAKYLCAPEVKLDGKDSAIFNETLNDDNSIELDGVSAEWLDSDRPSLDRISIAAKPGELVLIAGKVGAGKSSLLQTLVNELTITSGSVRIKGKLSYASQEAWVFSGTVRENILFGAPMNMTRYLEVLKVCSLLSDLNSFSKLDMTYVGQRGVSLSGGQKARINLARCLYHEADVYLLDDPLSAVDAHVSKHIFHKAIKGFLAEKTVLLVTHQLQYMTFADKVLLITAPDSNNKITGATGEVIQKTHMNFMDNDDIQQQQSTPSSLMDVLTEEKNSAHELILDRIKGTSMDQMKEVVNEMKDTIEISESSRVWKAYMFYVKNAGSLLDHWLFLGVNFMIRIFFLGTPTWMTYWAQFHGFNNESFGSSWIEQMNFEQAITISAYLWIGLTIITAIRSTQMFAFVMRAAEGIHDKLMRSLLMAKMRFFDLTPSGQVINRVAADLSYMDTTHITLLDELSLTLISSFFMLGAMLISDIRLGVSLIIMAIIGYWIFRSYINLTNTVKKADGIRKGDIYTHTSITLDGLTTIRATGKSELFSKMYDQIQDKSSSVSFLHTSIKRLIIVQLDWLMLAFYCTLIALDVIDATKGEGLYAFVGLNLVMQLARNTQYAFTKFVELYTRVEALNRIEEYCNIQPEITSEEEVQSISQSSATIKEARLEFIGVSLRYEPMGDIVLRNVSFVIEPREKIGIVGRTGAGKSSLISVLFRLYHFEGFVEIDGQNTKCMPLDSIRRSISIIPQDPELLSGSLRRNLDPLCEYKDESLWQALEAVNLKQLIKSNDKMLELEVSDSGANFSVGQRQLICLARAILRRNKLLVLDEATANVDPETDQLIQRSIRTEFADCTVLTVAHKLSTIVDSDRIMVIDKGQLVEFDSPQKLLERDGIFASMIKSSGLKAHNLK